MCVSVSTPHSTVCRARGWLWPGLALGTGRHQPAGFAGLSGYRAMGATISSARLATGAGNKDCLRMAVDPRQEHRASFPCRCVPGGRFRPWPRPKRQAVSEPWSGAGAGPDLRSPRAKSALSLRPPASELPGHGCLTSGFQPRPRLNTLSVSRRNLELWQPP